MIDFHTPGGVDRDGWQYAIDFPATYHSKKNFTDYVRRRRWYRKCRLATSGPWQEIGNSKIIDVTLQPAANQDEIDCAVTVWACAANGDVLLRRGVSQSCPAGTSWDHVACEQPLMSINSSPEGKVWAIGRNGNAFWRYGISRDNPQGEAWQPIESPNGVTFKQISIGTIGIWVLDSTGRLAVRKEVTAFCPEGTHWQILSNVQNDPPHYENQIGFKSVSVGDEVWAVSTSGYVCRRSGITKNNPAGTGWVLGISVRQERVGN
jgi:tectonin beta-propeller repeat-containing protein 1